MQIPHSWNKTNNFFAVLAGANDAVKPCIVVSVFMS
jgi:hypothetical protein